MIFQKNFRGFDFIETPKDAPSDIDGFIVRNGTIVSGVETKCRNMTLDDLKNKFNNEWLITADKLERGVDLCKRLCVEFRGFLFLVPDKKLIITRIFTPKDGWCVEPAYDHTETQETVNGGRITRLNAYIDLGNSTIVE